MQSRINKNILPNYHSNLSGSHTSRLIYPVESRSVATYPLRERPKVAPPNITTSHGSLAVTPSTG